MPRTLWIIFDTCIHHHSNEDMKCFYHSRKWSRSLSSQPFHIQRPSLFQFLPPWINEFRYSRSSCKENSAEGIFWFWLPSLPITFQSFVPIISKSGPSYQWVVFVLDEYITMCRVILTDGHDIVSIWGLLRIKLLWMFVCMSFCVRRLSLLLGK